jgi:L-rhamnose isomerase/sugar isomerase
MDVATQILEPAIREDRDGRAVSSRDDFQVLARRLVRAGQVASIEELTRIACSAVDLPVAVPSWGLGTGGTRFGLFPGPGEPGNVHDRIADVAALFRLAGGSALVSLHLPWDRVDDPAELARFASELGVGFDAVNSNTFQDQPDAELSYKLGSLSHVDPRVRRQAIRHNINVIEFGREIGSRALTVWLADGSNFPGQSSFRGALDRTVAILAEIYAALPADWRLFVEYKPFEPAFYSTVIPDWGTAYLVCEQLGPRAEVLVDLGHHLPGTNVEQIVARLIGARRLGGFHFNDSKYGDDDLASGTIHPYRLFLIFCELVSASLDPASGFALGRPAFMIDQSHNLEDPIEALILSLEEIRKAYIRSLLVDWARLAELERSGDVVLAERTLREAFEFDVRPILDVGRLERRAAVDPIAAYRASGYRERRARERTSEKRLGGGIV